MIRRGGRQTAQRALLTDLGENLKVWGFDPKPSGQEFYYKKQDGKWAFHISFIPHGENFDLTGDVALRLNAVEELVNRYDTKLKADEKKKSMTLGAELGNLSRGHPLRWTVEEVEAVPLVCGQVIDEFERIGLPFLQTFLDLHNANQVLCSVDSRSTLLCPVLGPRAMRAVACSSLVGNANDLRSVAAKYETELSESKDLYLCDFQTMCSELVAR